jgi:hypothetical protein
LVASSNLPGSGNLLLVAVKNVTVGYCQLPIADCRLAIDDWRLAIGIRNDGKLTKTSLAIETNRQSPIVNRK